MTIYSIDDEHGNQLVTGFASLESAESVAQEYANQLGAKVYVYGSDWGADCKPVAPAFDRDSVMNSDIRALSQEAARHGDTELVTLCELALNGDSDAAERCIDAIESDWNASH